MLYKKAVEAVSIPIHVMIRPHAKSFTYKEEEIEMMKEDIIVAQKLGDWCSIGRIK